MSIPRSHEVPLGGVADIKPGYPFRGAIKHDPKGEARVVQVRHLDPHHGLSKSCRDDVFDRVTLEGKRKPDYLMPGDILFVSRGSRFIAAVVPEAIPEETVCSQHFFLVRLNEAAKHYIKPDFLVWQINHREAQAYLARFGQGTLQHSVSKAQLKEFPVAIPHFERQTLVLSFQQAALEEAEKLQSLIKNREQQMHALGSAVLSEARATGQVPTTALSAPIATGHH